MAKLVSKIYGEALFEIAMESEEKSKGYADKMIEEIDAITEILKKNPEFDNLLLHPGISKVEKAECIKKVFEGNCSPELAGFFQTVVDKDRYGDLTDIFEYFKGKVKETEGIGVAFVTTPVQLDEKQKVEVKDKLISTTHYSQMEMHYQVDPSLVGGMIIRIGDRVIDSSIKNKLEKLTKQLLQIQLKQ